MIRPLWLDKVYEEAMFPSHFWMKGSMYRGDQWDGIPEQHPMQWERMQSYAYHINGVGIYRLGDAVGQTRRALTPLATEIPHTK